MATGTFREAKHIIHSKINAVHFAAACLYYVNNFTIMKESMASVSIKAWPMNYLTFLSMLSQMLLWLVHNLVFVTTSNCKPAKKIHHIIFHFWFFYNLKGRLGQQNWGEKIE